MEVERRHSPVSVSRHISISIPRGRQDLSASAVRSRSGTFSCSGSPILSALEY